LRTSGPKGKSGGAAGNCRPDHNMGGPLATPQTLTGLGAPDHTNQQAGFPLPNTPGFLLTTAHLSLKLSCNLFNLSPDAQRVPAPYLSDFLNCIAAPDEFQRNVESLAGVAPPVKTEAVVIEI